MNYPKVSIIILNWNGLENTIKCLESLKRVTYQNYEVVLVDNGSKENDVDVLGKKYKNYITLIRNEKNLGFAEGNNVAIREVIKEGKSDYILLLNNDTTIEPNFLTELVECSEKHPQAGSIQPKMILAKFNCIDSAGLEYSKNGFGFNRGAYEPIEKYNEEEEILGCCAGACLYRKEALDEIEVNRDYFDKDFFCSYEDVDLAFRLQWAGWKSWYCPQAIVYHLRGATTGIRSNFIIYHSARNQVWTLVKNFPNRFLLKNFHWIFIAETSQMVLNLLRKKPIILRAKFDTYKDLRKIFEKRKKIKKVVNFSEIEKWFIFKWRITSPYYSYFKKQMKL